MNYLDYDSLEFLIKNMKINNRNYLINPDFKINQRQGYITKPNYTLYTDKELTTEAVDIEIPTKLLQINGIFDNYAIIILNDITYYLNKSDIEPGYIGEKKYTLDRWYINDSNTIVKPTKDYIILGDNISSNISSIYQFLNSDYKFNNKTVTFTMKLRTHKQDSKVILEFKDGINELQCSPNCTGDWEIISITLKIANNYTQIAAGIKTFDIIDIAWAKLEIGDRYTPFEYPEPSIELIKCKYYYQEFFGRFKEVSFMTSKPKYVYIRFSEMAVSSPHVDFKYPNLENTGAYGLVSQGGSTVKYMIDSFTVLYSHSAIENLHNTVLLELSTRISATNNGVIFSGYNPICLNAEILPI